MINRSIAYKKVGKHDLAISDALAALEIGTKNENLKLQYQGFNQRGLIRKDFEDYEGAISFYEEANRIDYSKKAYVNLGIAYQLKGDIKTAIEYFNKAINYTKSNYTKFRALKKLGELYLDSNDFELAFENLTSAEIILSQMVEIEIENIDIYDDLGKYHTKVGQDGKAYLALQEGFVLQKKYNQFQNKLTDKFQQEAVLKTESEFQSKLDAKKQEDNHLKSLAGVILISILIITFFYLLYNKMKSEKEKIESKKENLRSSLRNFVNQFDL